MYSIPARPTSIPQAEWKWSTYAIDSAKGDEYQMNSRSGTTSFMDILNHVVVLQTQRRRYEAYDKYGEQYVNKQTMDA